jgi:predicted restriction endonuclease
LFRKRLLEKYDNTCIITGIATKKLLIASHIKPWAVSNNEERLSEENGLLLSPTYDKLFDYGLITFTNKGNVIVSPQISLEDRTKLHLSTDMTYDLKASGKMREHLDYHRDVIFVRR